MTTTSGAVMEHEEVAPLLQKHRFITGEEPQELVADAGYGIRPVFTLLRERGIQANIPPRTTHVTMRRKKEEAGFRYDSERGVWVCPEGEILHKMSQAKPSGHTLYMVNAQVCRECPRYGVLCKAKRPSIVDTQGDVLLGRVKDYIVTSAAKETFRRRKYQVEPAFAELKTSLGMRQASLRGNWRVQAEVLMGFAVYNIKRLVKAVTRGTRGAQEVQDAAACSLLNLVSRLLWTGRFLSPGFC